MYHTGWFSNNGPLVQLFEQHLRNYLKTEREIVAVSSATIGLMLALKGLQVQKKVLVPSFTFAATVAAIDWCKLDWEFVDIDPYWNMDLDLVEEKLQSGEYGAIMPVHIFGAPCDVLGLQKLADKYKVKLIFDAAGAVGSSMYGKMIGNFGDIEVFSLHATKVLPVGEGGFLSIKDKEVADRIRQLKNFGFIERVSQEIGLNGKMPEVMAAIGIEALKNLDQHLYNRCKYVKKYQALLGTKVKYQKIQAQGVPNNQCLSILVDNADAIVQKMSTYDIEVRQYFSPVHKHPAYKRNIELPRTIEVAKNIINLPLYSIMDNNIIEKVSKTLCEVIDEH